MSTNSRSRYWINKFVECGYGYSEEDALWFSKRWTEGGAMGLPRKRMSWCSNGGPGRAERRGSCVVGEIRQPRGRIDLATLRSLSSRPLARRSRCAENRWLAGGRDRGCRRRRIPLERRRRSACDSSHPVPQARLLDASGAVHSPARCRSLGPAAALGGLHQRMGSARGGRRARLVPFEPPARHSDV